MPGAFPEPLEFCRNVSTDPGPPVLGVRDASNWYPWEVPPTPRLRTIPLPPVDCRFDRWGHVGEVGGEDHDGKNDSNLFGGWTNDHHSAREWSDIPTLGITLRNLASAGLGITENGNRLGVSCAFTLLETVLCNNGFVAVECFCSIKFEG